MSWQFERKGVIAVPRTLDEDGSWKWRWRRGAEDLSDEGEQWMVTSAPADLAAVRTALEEAGHTAVDRPSCRWSRPRPWRSPPSPRRRRCCGSSRPLDDHDDVQTVYANYDIPDAVMLAYQG